MRNIFSVCALITLFMLVAVIGCTQNTQNSQDPVNPSPLRESDVVTITNTGNSCTMLLAGQNIDAGTVCLEDIDTDNDGISDSLEVTYTTTGCWELVEAQLWIGTDLSQMPQTSKGNPIPGQFPYKSGDITGLTTYTFTIPFTDLGFECGDTTTFFAAAHATVRCLQADGSYRTETGWGNGDRIVVKGSWAMYFTFNISCDGNILSETCETAWAYGGDYATCFTEYGFNNWGWTNGPLGSGGIVFDLYAGAAQCDLSKGTFVGTLTVYYDEGFGTLTATYSMCGDNTLEETQLYVGNAPLQEVDCQGQETPPCYTVAPGQFPYIHDLDNATTDTFEVSGYTGDIYVVAHSVVCWLGAEADECE